MPTAYVRTSVCWRSHPIRGAKQKKYQAEIPQAANIANREKQCYTIKSVAHGADKMAKHNLTQAAKLAGISRSTIMRHIAEGKLTKEFDKNGKPCIDTSEIERSYGVKQSPDTPLDDPMNSLRTPIKKHRDSQLEDEIQALRQEKIEFLEKQLQDLRNERDQWQQEAHDWKRQAQSLLADQTSVSGADTSKQKKSWFGWKR